MALFTVDHIHRWQNANGYQEVLIEISKDIKLIYQQNQKIMASITELTQKVDALQTQVTDLTDAVNTEQQQVTDAINALNQTIQELQTSGGTVEERQALSDKLTAISTGLQSAKDDLASTIADTTPPPPPIEG
jgi:predicted  nucleic acid-binding Zn-ribbon protein